MAKPLQRLFTPGSGATPPVLAGRKAEQEVLRQCLADLAAGVSPPHDVALIGPRDNHIDAALKAVASSESSRLAIREQLNALGYIWCPRTSHRR